MISAQEGKPTDRVKIFETLLSSPGMNEACKIVITLSRKTILILSRLVECGIDKESSQG